MKYSVPRNKIPVEKMSVAVVILKVNFILLRLKTHENNQ